VRLRVFDPTGRLIRVLVEESLPAGSYTVTWDGADENGSRTGSGVYFSRLDVGGERLTRRIIVL